MKLLDRIAQRFGYAKRSVHRRAFDASQTPHFTDSWTTHEANLNQELYRGLRVIRARSRDLARNNDYARRFLGMCVSNVAGPTGINLQVHVANRDGEINETESSKLESAFAEWGKRGNCEVTGKLSWLDLQRVFIRTVATDGEIIVRKVIRRDAPFGFLLQLLDPALLDVDLKRDLPGGGKIRMGVELDSELRPVAYHFLPASAVDLDSIGYYGQQHVRVPANEILHAFVAETVNQLRGAPWMHTAMRRTWLLGDYEQAAAVAANNAAKRLGFFLTPDGTPPPVATAQDESGQKYQTTVPGQYDTLPIGYDFKAFESDYPHTNYADFVKACLRGIASGLGVSYTSLANDLEGVNYSSARVGVIEERELWKALQEWMIGAFCAPVYSAWLPMALLSRRPELSGLSFDRLAAYEAAHWQGRRWAWVDPLKEMAANKEAIALGITSRSRVIRDQGNDPETIWRELEREKLRLKDLLPQSDGTTPPANPPDDEDEDEKKPERKLYRVRQSGGLA